MSIFVSIILMKGRFMNKHVGDKKDIIFTKKNINKFFANNIKNQ